MGTDLASPFLLLLLLVVVGFFFLLLHPVACIENRNSLHVVQLRCFKHCCCTNIDAKRFVVGSFAIQHSTDCT
jgi:hypothetical protein